MESGKKNLHYYKDYLAKYHRGKEKPMIDDFKSRLTNMPMRRATKSYNGMEQRGMP